MNNFDNSELMYYYKDPKFENMGVSFYDPHSRDLGTADFLASRDTHQLFVSNDFYGVFVFKLQPEDSLKELVELSDNTFLKKLAMNYKAGSLENKPFVHPLDQVQSQVTNWLAENGITADSFNEYKQGYLLKHWEYFDSMAIDIWSFFDYYSGFSLKFDGFVDEKTRMFDLAMRGINPNYVDDFAEFKGTINPRYHNLHELLKYGFTNLHEA